MLSKILRNIQKVKQSTIFNQYLASCTTKNIRFIYNSPIKRSFCIANSFTNDNLDNNTVSEKSTAYRMIFAKGLPKDWCSLEIMMYFDSRFEILDDVFIVKNNNNENTGKAVFKINEASFRKFYDS